MKHFISIFEVPAVDFSWATNFYESVLDIKIEEIDVQGIQMGLFPGQAQEVAGVIVKGEGYNPSTDGVLIYLNGGDDLQPILDKIVAAGGQVVLPKTLIDETNGYFALFIDTEGNKLGLHSLN